MHPKRTATTAFSLIEVVLAVGILSFAVLIVAGMLSPTLQSVDDLLSKDKTAKLVSTVNAFLQNNATLPADSFLNVYELVEINQSSTNEAPPTNGERLFAYAYRADPSGTPRADDTLPPFTGTNATLGTDYIIAHAVRPTNDTLFPNGSTSITHSTFLNADLTAIEGDLFFIRIDAYTNLIPTNIPIPLDPDPTNYTEAVLPLQISFFKLPSTSTNSANLSSTNIQTNFTYNTAIVR